MPESDNDDDDDDDDDDARDRSVSCEEFDKIMAYSDKICNDLLRESTSTAAEESSDDKSVTLDNISQFSSESDSVSEYSNFLLSRILNDAGLNGVSKDLDNTFVMSRNSRNFLEMQGIESVADSSSESSSRSSRTNEEGIPSSANRVSGISLASTLSATSDGSTDSESLSVTPTVTVTDSGETLYKFPSTKEESNTPDVVHKPYRSNGGLESIREVSDSTENDNHKGADDSDESSLKSEGKKVDSEPEENDQKNGKISSVIQCNGKVDSKRTHPSVQGTNSGSSSSRGSKDYSYDPKFFCGRKESNASTQSVDSNLEDDEERDVISEFKKREEKLASFGSSLRLNMVGGKKVGTESDSKYFDRAPLIKTVTKFMHLICSQQPDLSPNGTIYLSCS